MESPWKVITAFVGVFVAGSLFGGLLTLRVIRQRDQQTRMVQVSMAPELTPATGGGTSTTTPTTKEATPSTTTSGSTVAVTPTSTTVAPQPGPVRPPLQQVQALPINLVGQAPGLMRRHVEKLDLTPDQKERILPLINRAAKDLTRQQQTNFRETSVILQHLQEDVTRELTAQQRTRLDELVERQRLQVEQKQREDQDILKRAREEKLEKRALKQAPKEGPIKPKGKPPEDGNN